MRIERAIGWACATAALLLVGCTGNGQGLDQNGQPIGSSSSGPLTADFDSIQANVFTPICSVCHAGPSAPEGLQLDAAHSYQLLVGVPSVEQPSLLRVKPGDPDDSYMVRKISGGPGISGGRMPLGEPALAQATIDAIRQWITNGAPMGASMPATHAQRGAAAFEVRLTAPEDGARVRAPLDHLIVGFTREVDFSLVNASTIVLERLGSAGELLEPFGLPLPLGYALALGDPSVVVARPLMPLGPGRYRVTVRGTGGGAVADLEAGTPGADFYFVFTVEATR